MQMNKNELKNVVRSAVKDFIHAHPRALEPRWVESVTKRVAGQIHCHFVHNKNNNNGKDVEPPKEFPTDKLKGREKSNE